MRYVLLLLLGITAAYAKPKDDTKCNNLTPKMEQLENELKNMEELLGILHAELEEATGKCNRQF